MARLMVVANDVAVLELVTRDLKLEGHEILATATDGETAVRLCGDLDPEVLVVDLRLGPGIDGLAVARAVAADGTRVVLHTNYVNATIVDAAHAVGVTVVEKVSLRALRRAVVGP